MKKINLVITLLLCTASLFSQDLKEKSRSLKWTMTEKIKLDPQELRNYLATDGIDEADERLLKSLKYTDAPVAQTSYIDAEVHAAINPTDSNNIVVSPIRQSGNSLQVPLYYTKNFGNAWIKSTFNPMPSKPNGMSMGGGDPVFAFDETGKLFYTYIDLYIKGSSTDTVFWELLWIYSDDGGVTWNVPAENIIASSKLIMASQTLTAPVPDKQWMAIDRSGLAFHNSLYVSYASINGITGEATITIKHLREDSLAFESTTGTINTAGFDMVQFASLDVDHNGHVHVTFFGSLNGLQYSIFYASSTDGGVTFSSPVKVSDCQLPNYSAGQMNTTIVGIDIDRIYPSLYIAADQNNGDLHITWTANGTTAKLNNGLDIYLSSSTDGGNTWSTPLVVNDNSDTVGSHQFYSTIAIGKQGNVVVGWYDRRNDTNNVMTHYFFSESFDRGNTFSPAYQVTSEATDFSTIGASNNDFGIGEYTQILALHDYIIPIWTDGRLNNGNLNIYAAFINRNTMSVETISMVDALMQIRNIYPNPANGLINADIFLKESAGLKVHVVDLQGRTTLLKDYGQQNAGDHSVTIDVTSLAKGQYLLMLHAGNQMFAEKIILQ